MILLLSIRSIMQTNALTEAGLTQSESSVYIALELGTSRAAPIIQKTQLQMSVVHRALNSLIEKGLINFVMEGKHRVYQGTDPKILLRFMDEKKQRIEDILPELQKHRSLAATTENATVYKGINGIKEAYEIMINSPGKEYLTFGGGPPTAEVMGFHFWMNLHRRRVERKLKSRQVFDLSVKNIGGTEIEKLPLTKIRYVPADFAQFQETVIVGDIVCIAVFTKTPYALVINDVAVANGYKKYFESLWIHAK